MPLNPDFSLSLLLELAFIESPKQPPNMLYTLLPESLKTSKFKDLKENSKDEDTRIDLYYKFVPPTRHGGNLRPTYILYTSPYGIKTHNYTALIESYKGDSQYLFELKPDSLEAVFGFPSLRHLVNFYLRKKDTFNLNLIY